MPDRTGPDRTVTERTLDSFLNCCRDLDRISRFLIIADGLAVQDRDVVRRRYPFVELLDASPAEELYLRLSHIRNALTGRLQTATPDEVLCIGELSERSRRR